MIFAKYGISYDKFEAACDHYDLAKSDWEHSKEASVIINNLV